MKLLLVAATLPEIQPFIGYLQQLWTAPFPNVYRNQYHEIHICITGVGIMTTTFTVAHALRQHTYDFALQAGVGGSFDRQINLGDVVLVQSEQQGDLGAEDHEQFLDIYDLLLAEKDIFPFTAGKLDNPLSNIPFPFRLLTVSGLTVNTVSGCETTIARRAEKFGCQLESMEGAPFHYVCLQEHLPFAQVRSISNYVTPRDKSQWKMKDAIINLNQWLIQLSKDHLEKA
jgi:futalosine hydrolase